MIELPNKLLVSVHDVMPETLAEVRDIVGRLERRGRGPATLLVVPGRDWTPEQIDELRRWRDRGHELAGHGWAHRAPHIRGLWHRLHSLTVSRNAAEHLSYDGRGVADLIERCRAWFDQHGLGEPSLYVPPAWAMGSVRRLDIRRLGFRFFEYTSGFYDARIGVFQRVPLLGFEADTGFRAAFLRAFNRYNLSAAQRHGWLRVSIHPGDFSLRMSEDLTALIGRLEGQPALVSELFENGPPEALPRGRSARSGREVQAGEASSVS